MAVKFLIVAAPQEADPFRRAAFAARYEALAIKPGHNVSDWISAARPNAIVLSTKGMVGDVTAMVRRIRLVPGGDVPLIALCDESDLPLLTGLTEQALLRPVSPEMLVAKAAEWGQRHLAATRQRVPSHRPDVPPAPPVWSHDIATSIDQAIDAEMTEALHQVTDRDVPARVRDRQIDQERVQNHKKLVQEGTYFQVLGVETNAPADEVERAFMKIADALSDEALGPELAHEMADDLRQIRLVLDEARTILTDPDLGQSYRLSHLETNTQTDAVAPAPVSVADPSGPRSG